MNQSKRDQRILEATKNARVFSQVNIEEALEKTKQRIEMPSSSGKRNQQIRLVSVWRVAASIVLTLGLGWSVYYFQFAPKWISISSGEEIKEVKLPDGSMVSLNKGTTLKYQTNARSVRHLELSGEAFFNVKRDESRPFIVETNEIEVTVLGTSFNVDIDSTKTIVSVASGKVAVHEITNNQKLILSKNEAAGFHTADGVLTKSDPDPNYLSWKTGLYTFEQGSALHALQVLAESKGLDLNIAHDALEGCRITSTFDNQSWKEIINEYNLLFPITIREINETSYEVKGSGCK